MAAGYIPFSGQQGRQNWSTHGRDFGCTDISDMHWSGFWIGDVCWLVIISHPSLFRRVVFFLQVSRHDFSGGEVAWSVGFPWGDPKPMLRNFFRFLSIVRKDFPTTFRLGIRIDLISFDFMSTWSHCPCFSHRISTKPTKQKMASCTWPTLLRTPWGPYDQTGPWSVRS